MKSAQKDQVIQVLATGFGAGLSPVAPGTVGTLVGLVICLFSYPLAGRYGFFC